MNMTSCARVNCMFNPYTRSKDIRPRIPKIREEEKEKEGSEKGRLELNELLIH